MKSQNPSLYKSMYFYLISSAFSFIGWQGKGGLLNSTAFLLN